MAALLSDVLTELENIGSMMADFRALCDAGGRFSGTESEKAI